MFHDGGCDAETLLHTERVFAVGFCGSKPTAEMVALMSSDVILLCIEAKMRRFSNPSKPSKKAGFSMSVPILGGKEMSFAENPFRLWKQCHLLDESSRLLNA